jgi:hypothetical protein
MMGQSWENKPGGYMKRFFIILLCLSVCGCATVDYTKLREDYVASHPQLSEQTKADIRGGSIRPGMTREEVQASWNISDNDFTYGGTKSCSAMGCIESLKWGRTYLTFYNGKLQSWTDVNY